MNDKQTQIRSEITSLKIKRQLERDIEALREFVYRSQLKELIEKLNNE